MWVCKAPKCHAENSDNNYYCWKCHRPKEDSKKNPKIYIAITAICLIVTAALAVWLWLPSPPPENLREQAYYTPSSTLTQTVTLTPEPTPTATETPKYAWSEWSSWSTNPATSTSTREVETRQKETVIGYQMVCYVTRRDDNKVRLFRDYSVNGAFWENGLDQRYGEKVFEKSVTAAQMDGADAYPADGSLVGFGVNDDWYGGLQVGSTTAYNFGDDNKVWFVANTICENVTEYRHRDLVRIN